MKRFYLILFLQALYIYSKAQLVFETTVGDPDCYEEAFTAYGNALYVVSSNYNCNQGPGNFTGNIVLLNEQGDSVTAYNNFKGSGFYAFEDSPNGNKFIFAGGEKSGLAYDTIILSKVNDMFNKDWEQQYTLGVCNNVVYDVAVVDDGYLFTGFYSTQNCQQNASYDAFVLKLDKDGNEQWLTLVGGMGNQQFYVVKPLGNGEIAAFGWTDNTTNNIGKYFLVRLNADGDSVSSFMIDTGGDFRGYGMDVTPDGNFIFSGTRNNSEIIIMKTDAGGNVLWSNNLGVPCGSSYYKAYTTLDNEYVFSFITSGSIGCETTLMKTDTAGNELWRKVFPATIRTVTQPAPGSFLLAGFKLRSDNFISDAYIARFDTTFNNTSVTSRQLAVISEATLFPNPVHNDAVNITFKNISRLPAEIIFYDVAGKETMKQKLFREEGTIQLLRNESNVLLYNIKYSDGYIERGKVFKF